MASRSEILQNTRFGQVNIITTACYFAAALFITLCMELLSLGGEVPDLSLRLRSLGKNLVY